MPITPSRCRHLHTDGRQCGSPALRGHVLCFQHDPLRRPMPARSLDGRAMPQLPAPDDFLAIQRGIGEILRLAAAEELTDRRAATLLRGYAVASQNLARHLREERRQQSEPRNEPVTDCVDHPELGTLALPGTLTDGVIPIQQNQDLSPLHDKSETHADSPEHSETEAAPHPQPRFTPLAGNTLDDELALGELHLRLEESFRDRRRAFIHEKTAELEAQFQQRLEAEIERRLQTEHAARPQPAAQSRQPELAAA